MNTLLDPVCGMEVDESALRAAGYDDVAFCAEGCRQTFLADPVRYTTRRTNETETASDATDDHMCGCGHHGETGGHGAGGSARKETPR